MVLCHSFIFERQEGNISFKLQREIGVTYKTAWRMLQQIRMAMGNAKQKEFVNTIIEMDEAYVGGKPRKQNKHDDNDKKPGGRGTEKTCIIGAVDRNNKAVYAKVSLPSKAGHTVSFTQILDVLSKVSNPKNRNTIITDQYPSYKALGKKYVHLSVDHSCMFADGEVHTNNIESFWATLKRGVYGIYHHVSVKYMQRYVDEFCFRYNNRRLNMFDMVLGQTLLCE